MPKCLICERKPAGDQGFCHNCAAKIESDSKHTKERPEKFIHYHGMVIGLYRQDGKLVGRYLKRSLAGLPKSRVIDLDIYCPGYTREQIKAFKSAVLKLAHA